MLDYLINRGYKLIDEIKYNTKYLSEIYELDDNIIIIDYNFDKENSVEYIFSYGNYCEVQNNYMLSYNRVLRFNYIDLESFITDFNLFNDDTFLNINNYSNQNRNEYYGDNTFAEKSFEDIFVEAFGNDSYNYLHKEYPITDIYGNNYYIDYVVETNGGTLGFEANGVNYHHPLLIGKERYKTQLLKQNTMMYLGLKLYRYSSENILFKDKIIDNLRLIEKNNHFLVKPVLTDNRSIKLYDHQEEVLSKLDVDRSSNINTQLIVLPTGSGKSQIILEDLKKNYIKDNIKHILILCPTIRIINDWKDRVNVLNDYTIDIVSYNKAYKDHLKYDRNYYDYIVFDEAHHALSNNNKMLLSYYTPKYLIGLTATDYRGDLQKLETIFGTYEVNLSIEEAINNNIISNIRCFRIKSNIDLSNIRFNGKDYNYSELEKSVIVDSRNLLIVNTILKYFSPQIDYFKQGIIFCVNKEHTIKLAKLLNENDIKAAAVYGGNKSNDIIFSNYTNKNIQFLCTCQLISEGWDSPQTEVVVMARPTLSKTLYVQQIGRGTRKYKGKECLYVIDIVDNYESKLVPWSFNALFKLSNYKPFMDVKGLPPLREDINILGLNEYEMKMEEVDIFTFEEKLKDYYSLEETARELYVGTNTLKKWYLKDNFASLTLTIGNRKVPYFNNDDIDKIRIVKNLKIHNDSTILEDFIDFIDENTLTFSFKLVFLLSCFKVVDNNGEIDLDLLLEEYRDYYISRYNNNLKIEKDSCVLTIDYLNDKVKMKRSMLDNPFEKFERKRFLYLSKDLNRICFNPILWSKLNDNIIVEIIDKENEFLKKYYDKFVKED